MKICLFDHHYNTYPIKGYGGIERVNQLLFKQLSLAGYDVTLICVEGSTLSFNRSNSKLITLPFEELENIRYGRVPVSFYFNGDIFHTHTSSTRHCAFDFEGFKGKWVATCHGYQEWAGSKYQTFVSNNQYNQHVSDMLIEPTTEYVFITHGCVDDDLIQYSEGSHDRLIWLGRICEDKGIDRLISIADQLNEPVIVAGTNCDDYLFNKLINCTNIEYIGEIRTEQAKKDLFAQAKASIHTSTFQDPFPLTILEAQMCGVPVIAWANGSMRESNYDLRNVHDSKESIVAYLKNNQYLAQDRVKISEWAKNSFGGANLLSTFVEVYNFVLSN